MSLSTGRMYSIIHCIICQLDSKRTCQIPHLAVNLSFTQASSYKMELVLQYLSAHAFIMAHHTHKDTCCSKDAAFGEVTTEKGVER